MIERVKKVVEERKVMIGELGYRWLRKGGGKEKPRNVKCGLSVRFTASLVNFREIFLNFLEDEKKERNRNNFRTKRESSGASSKKRKKKKKKR